MKRLVYSVILFAAVCAHAETAPPPPPVAPPQPPPAAQVPPATTPGAPAANVDAIGQSPIGGGDRVRARERALDEAFRAAVEQAAAALLGPQAMAERASLLKLTIQPKARGYVTGYRVVEEGEVNGFFRVRVAAVLDLPRLQRDLQPRAVARPDAKRITPRALVCVAERHESPAGPPAWIAAPDANRLAAAVTAAGIEIGPMPAGCVPEGDAIAPADARAAEAARAASAQAAIIGTIVVTSAGPIRGTPLLGAHAVAELHLVEADGRVSFATRGEHDGWGDAAGTAAAPSARGALDAAIAKLQPVLAQRWPRDSGVTLRVEGIQSWADLQLVSRASAAVAGVTAVELRRFSIEGAELLVRGEVNAPDLAAGLQRSADAARFRALSRGDRAAEVEVLAPPAPPAPPALPPPPPLPVPAP